MDEKKIQAKPIESCILIFFVCSIARLIEYFFIRTDETILAENFIHKVFGVVVLAVVLKLTQLSWAKIGFVKTNIVKGILNGIVLGTVCFSIAYLLEYTILYCMNGNAQIAVYVSGFSLNGEVVKQSGIMFIILCIIFNIINVWMEEGIFRGLFSNLLVGKMGANVAYLYIALLFGIWHWVMPLRDFVEGRTTITNLLIMGIGYIILAGIMSIKWSILYQTTGSLWMGLGDHLFNNAIVTNLLHVISENEADSMQIIRILVGQLISFIIVIVYYKKKKRQ